MGWVSVDFGSDETHEDVALLGLKRSTRPNPTWRAPRIKCPKRLYIVTLAT